MANEPLALRSWLRGFSEAIVVAWPAFHEAINGEVEQIRLVDLLRCNLLPEACPTDKRACFHRRRNDMPKRNILGKKWNPVSHKAATSSHKPNG